MVFLGGVGMLYVLGLRGMRAGPRWAIWSVVALGGRARGR
jgi:hypothetical protein